MTTDTITLPSIRDSLRDIADRLPDDATWDDVLDTVFLYRSIERGLRDVAEGRVFSNEEVKKRLGIVD